MIFDFDVLDLLDETVFVSRYGFPSIFWVKIGFNYGKTVNFWFILPILWILFVKLMPLWEKRGLY